MTNYTRNRIKVVSGGGPATTQVLLLRYEDGELVEEVDISDVVTAVDWTHGSPGEIPTAEIRVLLVKLEAESGEVRWHGLEDIPHEALRAELEDRQVRDAEVTT